MVSSAACYWEPGAPKFKSWQGRIIINSDYLANSNIKQLCVRNCVIIIAGVVDVDAMPCQPLLVIDSYHLCYIYLARFTSPGRSIP